MDSVERVTDLVACTLFSRISAKRVTKSEQVKTHTPDTGHYQNLSDCVENVQSYGFLPVLLSLPLHHNTSHCRTPQCPIFGPSKY